MRTFTLAVVVIAGLSAAYLSGHFVLRDWAALNAAWGRFETVVGSNGDQRTLLIAVTQQAAYRTNCFAEGVGVLLGALIAAIGVHGLCLLRERDPHSRPMG